MTARHQPAKSLLFAEFCKKFPDLRRNPGETGSHMTAYTTTQSPQTAPFSDDAKECVSAGISGQSFLGSCSLWILRRFGGHCWRLGSSPQKSGPGGQP